MLAVTAPDAVSVIDVATLRRRKTLTMAGRTTTTLAEFTSDGRFLITGNLGGEVQLWSTRTWRPATPPLATNTGTVTSASISPDGRTLAAGSTDGTIRLLDLRTERPLGTPLSVLPNSPVGAQFSPDGAYLFGITDAGRAARWDVRPASWARQACAVAGRALTRAEWDDALPGRPYAPACRH